MNESVALGDSAQVFVGHGHCVSKRVQQDRIGGFRPHSGQCQQAAAQGVGGLPGQRIQ
jgi:hypothetical protein